MALAFEPLSEVRLGEEDQAAINPSQELGEFAFEVEKYDFDVSQVTSRVVGEQTRWYVEDGEGAEKRITKHAGLVLKAYFEGRGGVEFSDYSGTKEVRDMLPITNNELSIIEGADKVDFRLKYNNAEARRRTFEVADETSEAPHRLNAKLGAVATAYLVGVEASNQAPHQLFEVEATEDERAEAARLRSVSQASLHFRAPRPVEDRKAPQPIDRKSNCAPMPVEDVAATKNDERPNNGSDRADKAHSYHRGLGVPKTPMGTKLHFAELRALAFEREGRGALSVPELLNSNTPYAVRAEGLVENVMAQHDIELLEEDVAKKLIEAAKEVVITAKAIRRASPKLSKARFTSYIRHIRSARGVASNRSHHRRLEKALDDFHEQILQNFYGDRFVEDADADEDPDIFEDEIFESGLKLGKRINLREQSKIERRDSVKAGGVLKDALMEHGRALASKEISLEEYWEVDQAHYEKVEKLVDRTKNLGSPKGPVGRFLGKARNKLDELGGIDTS